jgi:hypothetical protein
MIAKDIAWQVLLLAIPKNLLDIQMDKAKEQGLCFKIRFSVLDAMKLSLPVTKLLFKRHNLTNCTKMKITYC